MTSLQTRTDIAVVATGIANSASVLAAAERAGGSPRLVDDVEELRRASFVILPGVGSFGAAAEVLDRPLRNALRRRIELDRPTLGICLGMQLFCTGSAEAPGAHGLGLVPRSVERLRDTANVPALGWSEVTPEAGCELLEAGWAYFAHSYALDEAPGPWSIARAGHGNAIAAFEHGNVLACQFHPELSGAYGRSLIERWIQRGNDQ